MGNFLPGVLTDLADTVTFGVCGSNTDTLLFNNLCSLKDHKIRISKHRKNKNSGDSIAFMYSMVTQQVTKQ